MNTPETRLLQFLVEDRRRRVDQRTGLLNQLTGRLKLYFPQILRWFPSSNSILMWQFLDQWPDLQSAQKASRQKMKAFLVRDGRSCPADVDEFIQQVREAIPATKDRAVVAIRTGTKLRCWRIHLEPPLPVQFSPMEHLISRWSFASWLSRLDSQVTPLIWQRSPPMDSELPRHAFDLPRVGRGAQRRTPHFSAGRSRNATLQRRETLGVPP